MNYFCVLLFGLVAPGASMHAHNTVLAKAPERVTAVNEIAVVYNHNLADLFNEITPQERIFIYYMFRASLAGNIIARDQSHRDALAIIAVLEYVLEKKEDLLQKEVLRDAKSFLKDVEVYLTYLWTNHSQYFVRESADEKRTPERLNLLHLTPKNLTNALTVLGYPDAELKVNSISRSLFDRQYESTQTVPNSIDTSAVNFYSADFTDEDFAAIDSKGQSALNAYFYIDQRSGKRVPAYQLYSVEGKYAHELSVIVHWLEKAHDIAQNYPEQFDAHVVKSLAYLIEYFKTGDEELFKKHSIEWLKIASRIDYAFGFIETYSDPKSYRAIFQSDVTIKSLDIDTLNAMLPDIERRLPIKKEYKRQTLEAESGGMPNASINVKAFTAGSLGPINSTLAYCLPNYEEIRSEHGSKQIMYHAEKSVGELINPKVSHRLFNGTEYFDWFEKNDPDYQLMRDIFMLEVILHETLGHGSGRPTEHTFQEGEQLTIEGKTYAVGDTIPVTSSNIQQLLAGYDQTIEELRAEIIALLAAIECYDDFVKIGMLKEWPNTVSKEKIIDFSIISMARTGLRRLIQQADSATEVSGDHARANTTILQYLIDAGAIELRTESVTIDGAQYSVLDVYIIDRHTAYDAIKRLANLVQEIKSTGDGLKAEWLIKQFGTAITPEHMRIMKDNMKAAAGDIKVSALLYPLYTPVRDAAGKIIDIKAEWPESLAQEYQLYKKLALSTIS